MLTLCATAQTKHTTMKDVIRFYRAKDKKELVHKNVTLEQAQEWCNSPVTKKEGVYFDGYDDHNTHKTEGKLKYKTYSAPTKENH